MDEVTEDDPYRVILASDIEGFLVFLPQASRWLFLDAFVIFSGLPPVSGES
jgi:hypothetical protein